MEQRNDKKGSCSVILHLFKDIFLRTVGSFGGFFIDEDGHIVEDCLLKMKRKAKGLNPADKPSKSRRCNLYLSKGMFILVKRRVVNPCPEYRALPEKNRKRGKDYAYQDLL